MITDVCDTCKKDLIQLSVGEQLYLMLNSRTKIKVNVRSSEKKL